MKRVILSIISVVFIYVIAVGQSSSPLQPVNVIGALPGRMEHFALAPSGELMALASDKHVALHSCGTGVQVLIQHFQHQVRQIEFSPNSKLLAIETTSGEFHIWDISNLAVTSKAVYRPAFTFLGFTPDSTRIVGGDEERLYCLDIRTGEVYAETKQVGEYGPLRAASKDGSAVAFAGNGKSIRVFDLSSRKYLGVMRGHTSKVSAIALSSDGSILVSVSEDGAIRAWNVGSFRTYATGHVPPLPGTPVSISVCKDLGVVIVGGSQGIIQIMRIVGDTVVPLSPSVGYFFNFMEKAVGIETVAESNSFWIATPSQTSHWTLGDLDSSTGRRLIRTVGSGGYVSDLMFTNKGNLLYRVDMPGTAETGNIFGLSGEAALKKTSPDYNCGWYTVSCSHTYGEAQTLFVSPDGARSLQQLGEKYNSRCLAGGFRLAIREIDGLSRCCPCALYHPIYAAWQQGEAGDGYSPLADATHMLDTNPSDLLLTAAFSPDSTLLAVHLAIKSAAYATQTVVLDAAKLEAVSATSGLKVDALSISSDNQWLAVAWGGDEGDWSLTLRGLVSLEDVVADLVLPSFPGDAFSLFSTDCNKLYFSPDSRYLAVEYTNYYGHKRLDAITIWDLFLDKPVLHGSYLCGAFSPDGKRFIALSTETSNYGSKIESYISTWSVSSWEDALQVPLSIAPQQSYHGISGSGHLHRIDYGPNDLVAISSYATIYLFRMNWK